MRLRRIEAVRYGALADATLGDLGDGLTVVHGPNEAGKSTFTALVRHVLYGYPTARERDAGYHSSAGARLGRLVFEAEEGSWVVERAEGAHGGAVAVRALAGADRPGLLGEITRGVSPEAFRVVFGFGLDEMARIEEMRGGNDDIIARLNAASAGLRISPHEVRSALEKEAGELFKPRGRNRVINNLVSEVRGYRSELRELRAEADSFGGDMRRVRELEELLGTARVTRDEALAAERALELALERASGRRDEIRGFEDEILELRQELKTARDAIEGVAVDDALLGSASDIEITLGDLGGFTEGLSGLERLEQAVSRAEARVAEAAASCGMDPERAVALGYRAGLAEDADAARDDLQRLSQQVETRDEEAQRAAEGRAAAHAAAAAQIAPLDLDSADPAEAIAERLAAVEALEVARGSTPGSLARSGPDVPALVMTLSGVAAIIAGAVLGQWTAIVIGAVLVGAGAYFLLRRARSHPETSAAVDESPYLRILALGPNAGPLDLARVRRALEAARAATSTAREATSRAEEASRAAALARDTLETRRLQWVSWLEQYAMDVALSPPAASRVLAQARDAAVAATAAAEARADVVRATERLDAYTSRLTAVAAPFADVPDPLARDGVVALANRLRERLASARELAGRRAAMTSEATALESRLISAEGRLTRAAGELKDVLESFGVAEGAPEADLRALHDTAARKAREAAAAYDELAGEKNQLEGRLQQEAREARGSELRLRESGAVQRLGDAIERYAELSVASALLGRAQERYERERQPDVVRHAQETFRRITGDRYVGLSVPLGEGRIEVFDERSAVRGSDLLSRGTAEQLYLSLRLGLVAHLGDVGAGLPVLMDDVLVNFDPDRRRGAAEAIAEFSTIRQVVLFTCHPETATLMAEVAPDHERIELERCR
jgi:uncharacterized protein YhaN